MFIDTRFLCFSFFLLHVNVLSCWFITAIKYLCKFFVFKDRLRENNKKEVGHNISFDPKEASVTDYKISTLEGQRESADPKALE